MRRADEPGLVREGKYWVQTVDGSAPLPATEILKVSTRGVLLVQGEARPDVVYVLKKRARVQDPERARALLSQVSLKMVRRGAGTVLEVYFPAGGLTSADLRVRVPRKLRADGAGIAGRIHRSL